MEKKSFTPFETTGQTKKIKRFRTGFTLIEIFVGLIIISILASLSIASYRKTVEANKDGICKENLKVLQKAIDIYTLENDSLPLTLAQLTPQQIYLAHSQVVDETKENHFTAALRNILGIKLAWAQSLAKYYASNRNIFRCPADATAFVVNPGDCSVDLTTSFTCGSYTFNFKDGETTITSSPTELKKDSTYALVYDSAVRHRGKSSGNLRRNGITPRGLKGRMHSSESDKVGKVRRNAATLTALNCISAFGLQKKLCENKDDEVPEDPADD